MTIDISDDFSTLDTTTTWSTFDTNTAAASSTGSVLQITGATGTNEVAGIQTQSTYDVSATYDVEIDFGTVTDESWIAISLTQSATGNPFAESNWVRFGTVSSGNWYVQGKVGGSLTINTNSTGGGGSKNYRISFPASGNEVRFLINDSQVHSLATYPLASRTVYFMVYSQLDPSQTPTFDNFLAESTAVGGSAIVPIVMRHYRQRRMM